ncbi:MAG: hypothetical protein JWM21_943 [Acidobacteria bacterium]|nr:hypothetical protein [Acidobacteriota bacterium]
MANPGSPNFDPAIYDPAFVRHCYENFLRRPPDSGGFAFWVVVLNSSGDYSGVISAVSSFPEYRNRNNFHCCPSLGRDEKKIFSALFSMLFVTSLEFVA